MDIWLIGAGSAGAIVAVTHLGLGGREIARPTLTGGQMASVVRYTNYFCWHLVSAALALMSAGFFYSALPQRPAAPAAAATLFAATATILCLWLIVRFRLNPTHHPQWILFLPVVILGCLGLWR